LTQAFGTNSTVKYSPTQVGNYQVNVFAKDTLSQKEYDDVKNLIFSVFSLDKISSFQSNKTEYLEGDSINLTAIATLGSGSYLYKYVILKDGVNVSTIDYNSLGSLQYIANAAGNYSVTVYLKDVISKNEFDAQGTLSVKVYSPKLSAITASGSFYDGKVIAFNSSSTGASSLGISYKYEVYNNGLLIATRNYSTSSYSYTPTLPGIYTIRVYGKDGISSKVYDDMKQFNVIINSKPLYLAVLPVKYGMTSVDVTSLQGALVKLGYVISDTTGYFGTQTKNQVIAFQTSKGLTADGIVGNMSYTALNDALILKAGTKVLTY